MREIKFRAWDSKQEKMYFNVQNAYDTMESHWSEDEDAEKTEDWHEFYPHSFGVVLGDNRYEVMQYTGLRDRNGREIYEGDIVKLRNGTVREVKFGEYCFIGDEYVVHGVGFYLYSEKDQGMFGIYDCPRKENEVIGNIYQNPDLIK